MGTPGRLWLYTRKSSCQPNADGPCPSTERHGGGMSPNTVERSSSPRCRNAYLASGPLWCAGIVITRCHSCSRTPRNPHFPSGPGNVSSGYSGGWVTIAPFQRWVGRMGWGSEKNLSWTLVLYCSNKFAASHRTAENSHSHWVFGLGRFTCIGGTFCRWPICEMHALGPLLRSKSRIRRQERNWYNVGHEHWEDCTNPWVSHAAWGSLAFWGLRVAENTLPVGSGSTSCPGARTFDDQSMFPRGHGLQMPGTSEGTPPWISKRTSTLHDDLQPAPLVHHVQHLLIPACPSPTGCLALWSGPTRGSRGACNWAQRRVLWGHGTRCRTGGKGIC